MKKQNQSDRPDSARFDKNLNSRANSTPSLLPCLDSLLDIPWSPEASMAIDKWLYWVALEFEGVRP